MYRILLILYIIWGGVSIASGQDFNYSFTQLSTNYNPQNEMFRLLGTKRSFSQNETFFFSHP